MTDASINTGHEAHADGVAARTAAETHRQRPRVVERMPKWLMMVPPVLHWLCLGIRHRSLTLPSAANPHITTGGLVGDRKSEYFAGMAPRSAACVAPFALLQRRADTVIADVVRAMDDAGLSFPVIVKPDLGWCGFGVRHVADAGELQDYLDAFPVDAWLMVQRFIDEPGEAGIFYVRSPGEHRGRLLGILLRHPPQVVGDGRRTVQALVDADPRLSRTTSSPGHECRYQANAVPAKGEIVRMAWIGSIRIGGRYEDGSAIATPALLDAVDAIARDMPDFHAGRLDVRFTDALALRSGRFTIMEINGAGSEAVHAWDPRYTIWQTYAIVFAKQRELFALGATQRERGHPPVSATALARHFLHQRDLIQRYPPSN